MANKKKILSLILAVMFIMSIVSPVMADETLEAMPTNFEEIKAAFPQADIVNYSQQPDVAVLNVEQSMTDIAELDSYDPNSVPVNVFSRDTEKGTADLYVFEDGSYYLLGFEVLQEETPPVVELPIEEPVIQPFALGFGITPGSPNVGRASYVGTGQERLAFTIKYYTDQSIFCANPTNEYFIAPAGLAYINPYSTRTSANTQAYLRVTSGYYEYDALTNLPVQFVSTNYAKLTAKRNGIGGTPTVSVSYPSL